MIALDDAVPWGKEREGSCTVHTMSVHNCTYCTHSDTINEQMLGIVTQRLVSFWTIIEDTCTVYAYKHVHTVKG